MRIMTAHRILIAAAVGFFLLYAVWEVMSSSSGRGAWVRAALSGAGAVGLGIYFCTLPRVSR